MTERDPFLPPQSGDYIPPPPNYPPPPPSHPVTSDIPPQSPYHYSAAPSGKSRATAGGVGAGLVGILGFLKYGAVFLLKIPAAGTLLSLVLSFGGYALFYGPWFAVALVVMILVHEMGHVLEIRRQGMQATAPIFIPFLGAAIFQRSHPTDALKQAQIGIAGPVAGTLGATVAMVLYGATQNELFLLAAWIGFFINLFNLIPIWQLDGAWILGVVSPWFQVAALAVIGIGAISLHLFLSPLLIIFALLGIPGLIARFRNTSHPYYASVPEAGRWAMGLAWLALVLYLGVASFQASGMLAALGQ